MPAANSIFISYRRSDSNYVTSHVYEKLRSHFGESIIFKDTHSIPLGNDFRQDIAKGLENSQVLIAVIGARWLEALNQRTVEGRQDWVKEEIESALAKSDMPVIPLLIEGVQMPGEEDLPESLKALAYRNAAQVRPALNFDRDVERLIEGLEKLVGVVGGDGHSIKEIEVWSGAQLEAFQAALISAYPREPELKRLLRTTLDLRLNEIAGGENYRDVVFSLIESLETEEGKLLALAVAAHRKKPGNSSLRNFVATLPGDWLCD